MRVLSEIIWTYRTENITFLLKYSSSHEDDLKFRFILKCEQGDHLLNIVNKAMKFQWGSSKHNMYNAVQTDNSKFTIDPRLQSLPLLKGVPYDRIVRLFVENGKYSD